MELIIMLIAVVGLGVGVNAYMFSKMPRESKKASKRRDDELSASAMLNHIGNQDSKIERLDKTVTEMSQQILGYNKQVHNLHGEIDGLNRHIKRLNGQIDGLNNRVHELEIDNTRLKKKLNISNSLLQHSKIVEPFKQSV